MIAIDDRAADLRIVALLARARVRVAAPRADVAQIAVEHRAGAALHLNFLQRLAADEVDRATHAARSVENRHIPLLDLHFREIARHEAVHVDAVVGRQKDAHAVDRQRHLEAVEPAHQNIAFVARSARVERRRAGARPRYARHDADGLAEPLLIVGEHGFVGDRAAADHVELSEREGARCDSRHAIAATAEPGSCITIHVDIGWTGVSGCGRRCVHRRLPFRLCAILDRLIGRIDHDRRQHRCFIGRDVPTGRAGRRLLRMSSHRHS